MSDTLFDLSGEYKRLYELGVSEDEEDYQVFLDTLEALTGDISVKSEGYVKVINKYQMEKAKAKEISDRYSAYMKACENAEKRIKDRLLMCMDIMNVTEIPAGDFTIKIKKNGGLQPLKYVDGAKVPDNLTKITIEPDGNKVYEYLKEHDGKSEFAYLEERGRHIEIK